MIDIEHLKRDFQELYKRPAVGAIRAPGRVNLIGEHTDYNDGFVLPIAIQRQTVALYALRDDMTARFASTDAETVAEVEMGRGPLIAPGEPAWANYCKGVVKGLFERSIPLCGVDVLFSSDIPLGGGLSSSASLEVATALVLLRAADHVDAISPAELAALCQKAEHEFAGAPCGIMDQSIVIMGRAGHALLLDCELGKTQHVPLDDSAVVILVADTQVKHAISDGGYAARRAQCTRAAEALSLPSLRHADLQTIASAELDGRLTNVEVKRARHVVTEIRRTLQAVEAMKAHDYARFGELMYESHYSLRDDYEVSCKELDTVVEAASNCEGVFGSRMTGGGFGGCAIIAVRPGRADEVSAEVAEHFARRFGHPCPIFATTAADGAGVLW